MKKFALILLLIVLIIALLFLWKCTHGHGPGQGSAANCGDPCPDGQCTLVMPVPHDARMAVLSATSSLVIGNGSTITGMNGTPGVVGNLGKGQTLQGDHAIVGAIYSKSNVDLGAGAVVRGPVKTGGTV